MANKITTWITSETADATLPKVTHAVYNRTLLERALPNLVHQKFGQQRPLKRRNGTYMTFRRFESLDAVTSALGEMVDPGEADLTKTEITANISQYGNYVVVSDLLDMTGFDNTIQEAAEILGENMGESMDIVYREVLNAGTYKVIVTADDSTDTIATSGARTTVAGCITKKSLDKAINILARANAKKFTSLIQGADKDNTWPVAPSYWAVIHPDMERDLYLAASNLTVGSEFTPVERYANQSQVVPGEIGKYRSIRFIASTNAKRWLNSGATDAAYRTTGSGGADVYSCLVLGRDAYGIVPLEGGNTRTIIHRAGGTEDPLNQKNTVGWKSATTAVILQDLHMVRIEALSFL